MALLRRTVLPLEKTHTLKLFAQVRKETEFFTTVVGERPEMEPLRGLLLNNFMCWQVSQHIQSQALDGRYYDLVISLEDHYQLPEITGVEMSAYRGRIIQSFQLSLDIVTSLTHPTTFVRLSNLWKFSKYFSPKDISSWTITHQYDDKNAHTVVWAQWLLLNRIKILPL